MILYCLRLQAMLKVLEDYCRKWRFEVNVKKSKVMVCAEGEEGDHGVSRWMIDGKDMERISEHKYVGV